jgi:hypothetical protein
MSSIYMNLFIICIYESIYLCIYESIYLCIYAYIYYLYNQLYIYLPIYLSINSPRDNHRDRGVDIPISIHLTLEEENIKLKSEISKFDIEFFEELEDLKYRYSKLQGI